MDTVYRLVPVAPSALTGGAAATVNLVSEDSPCVRVRVLQADVQALRDMRPTPLGATTPLYPLGLGVNAPQRLHFTMAVVTAAVPRRFVASSY